MKIIFSLLIFLILVSPVFGEIEPYVQIDGGVSLLLSPEWYRVGWDDALGVSGGAGIRINNRVEVGARFAYRKFPADDYPLDIIGIYLEGYEFKTTELMTDIRLLLINKYESNIIPHLSFSFGMIRSEISDIKIRNILFIETIPGEKDTGFGFSLGAGIRYMINPTFGIYGDAKYTRSSLGDSNLSYLPLHAGLFLNF